MFENLKNGEIDEFWKDCINDNNKDNTYNNELLNHNNNSNIINKNNKRPISFKNFFKKRKFQSNKRTRNNNDTYLSNNISLNSKLISSMQTNTNHLKNIQEALKKEELINIRKHKEQEKLIKKFINLYNKDKSNNLSKKKNNNQKYKKNNLKLEEYTSIPDKYKNKKLEKKIIRLYNGSNIYERNIRLKKKHNEKISILYNEINKITCEYNNSECLFHPYINNNKNIKKILYDDSNIWIEQANNDSNKLFLLRYMKARELENDKRERLNSPINKKFRHNFSFPKKMVRSLSQQDSLIMKQNLHDTLYSIKNLFTDDEENENNKDNI